MFTMYLVLLITMFIHKLYEHSQLRFIIKKCLHVRDTFCLLQITFNAYLGHLELKL